MKRLVGFWKVVLIDALGLICILISPFLGVIVPGPGGIPLFLVGLGLLSVNHEWPKRVMRFTRANADRLSEYIFVQNPWIQAAYDILTVLLLSLSLWLLISHRVAWMVPIGISTGCMGLTILLCNRQRSTRFKTWIKHKH